MPLVKRNRFSIERSEKLRKAKFFFFFSISFFLYIFLKISDKNRITEYPAAQVIGRKIERRISSNLLPIPSSFVFGSASCTPNPKTKDDRAEFLPAPGGGYSITLDKN